MKKNELLSHIIEQVIANSTPFFSLEFLQDFEREEVDKAVEQKILIQTERKKIVICDGCEEFCPMRVNYFKTLSAKENFFVICDRRDDISRVPVPLERIEGFTCNLILLRDFIKNQLQLSYPTTKIIDTPYKVVLGVAKTQTSKLNLFIEKNDHSLILISGEEYDENLEDFFQFDSNGFFIDKEEMSGFFERAINSSSRSKKNLALEKRNNRILKEAKKLKRQDENLSIRKISDKIAVMPFAKSLSSETIRGILKKYKKDFKS